jgi:hypothetical protein
MKVIHVAHGNHIMRCHMSTFRPHCVNWQNVSISSHDMDTWMTLTQFCVMINIDTFYYLWKFQGDKMRNHWDISLQSFNFLNYAILCNHNCIQCHVWMYILREVIEMYILAQTANCYHCYWLCYTPSKFKIWASIVTLTFDLWPKYSFQTCYSMDTTYTWKITVERCAVSEEPCLEKTWRTNIVKKKPQEISQRLNHGKFLKIYWSVHIHLLRMI